MAWLRKVIERLATGSSALALRMARGLVEWVKEGAGVTDFLIRLVFLAIPVIVVWSLLAATTSVMWVLVIIWCVAAWRAVQPAQRPNAEKEPDLHPEDLAELLWELAGDRKGVHLAQVAQQLTRETHGRSWSIPDVKALLKAAGVPTRHSVRVAGLGVAVGVHRQDIPGSPSPAPSSPARSGVDAQVIPATATPATPYVRDLGGGARATFTPDPTNPVRTNVAVTKQEIEK
ncbi:hypothetical protein ABZX62_20335 [Streptomyces flavidovirens]|uniref:hypothetical protein n=1 Tax=Streptomyces flavidovirens TaxID=67298 RepID=UPI0033AEA8C6